MDAPLRIIALFGRKVETPFASIYKNGERCSLVKGIFEKLTVVLVTIALLGIFNGAAGWIWGPEEKFFESPFTLCTTTGSRRSAR